MSSLPNLKSSIPSPCFRWDFEVVTLGTGKASDCDKAPLLPTAMRSTALTCWPLKYAQPLSGAATESFRSTVCRWSVVSQSEKSARQSSG